MCQHRVGFFVRAIITQRRHDDTAGVEGIDVALRPLLARAAAEPDPVVGETARISPRLDVHALNEADTLTCQAERADFRSRQIGEVDAEAGRLTPADRQQLPHNGGTPRPSGRPTDIETTGPRLAQR